jgi:hypothetical protein
MDKLMPEKSKVRKSFSFFPSEKSFLNRLYRGAVDFILKQRYVCADFFFSVAPIDGSDRFGRIVELSQSYNVELMVHPQKADEYEYLMSAEYLETICGTKIGMYVAL